MESSSIVGSPCLSTSGCWTGKCYLLIYWCYCWCLRYYCCIVVVVHNALQQAEVKQEVVLLIDLGVIAVVHNALQQAEVKQKVLPVDVGVIAVFHNALLQAAADCWTVFFGCWCFFHRAVLKVNEASFVFCSFKTWWWNYLFICASTNLHRNTFVIICDKKKSLRKLTMKDIESIDPEFYNSLIWVSFIFFTLSIAHVIFSNQKLLLNEYWMNLVLSAE